MKGGNGPVVTYCLRRSSDVEISWQTRAKRQGTGASEWPQAVHMVDKLQIIRYFSSEGASESTQLYGLIIFWVALPNG